MVNCRISNFPFAVRIYSGHLQTTLSKWISYRVFRPTQSPTLSGRKISNSLQDTGQRPSVSDWGGGMSACCTAGPIASAVDGWSHNAPWYH